ADAGDGGDAGACLRDAGRRLWPCPQRPAAGAHLYKYNSGTGKWGDYTRLLNRIIAARWLGHAGGRDSLEVRTLAGVCHALDAKRASRIWSIVQFASKGWMCRLHRMRIDRKREQPSSANGWQCR